jgi:hypothetical protein
MPLVARAERLGQHADVNFEPRGVYRRAVFARPSAGHDRLRDGEPQGHQQTGDD